jgi:hypothetical protein
MTALPVPAREERRSLDALSPREIVAELDRWVVGQTAAKRAVAIALRTRIRRRSVSSFVSPGPLVPMPPPNRESAAPAPTRRGSR